MNTESDTTIRLALIEDADPLREEMVFGLGQMGFDVKGYANGADFFRDLVGRPCDIAVIDVGLPGEDGFSIAQHLRQSSSMGIVMLTARGQREDRLRGLDSADHYLVKPFDLLELGALLRALARRVRGIKTPERRTSGEWRLGDENWTLFAPNGQHFPLTSSERQLMQVLFASRDQAVARDDLITALGGDNFDFDPHRLETLISRLRKKASDLDLNLPVRAVRGVGYLLSPRQK